MLIHVVFDGPPGAVAGRFVEVEDTAGHGVSVGKWIHRPDGYWALELNVIRRVSSFAEQDELSKLTALAFGPDPSTPTILRNLQTIEKETA